MAILTEIESVKALTAGPLVHANLSAARLAPKLVEQIELPRGAGRGDREADGTQS